MISNLRNDTDENETATFCLEDFFLNFGEESNEMRERINTDFDEGVSFYEDINEINKILEEEGLRSHFANKE